jgi:cytochrome b involved in lipid metabolism
MSNQYKAFIIVGLIILVGIGAYFITSSTTSEQNLSEQDQTTNTNTTIQPAPDNNGQNAELETYTSSQVSEHDKKDDCWTIINGLVYDITAYVPRHPGGDEILDACGQDSTRLFTQRKTADGERIGSGTPHSSSASNQLQSYLIGKLSN